MASTVVKQLSTEKDELLFVTNDIMVNILKRLPVKSLLRFRCVCKDWNDLFKTSSFIKQHFHHSIHGSSLLLQSHCFTLLHDRLSLLDSEKKTLVPLNAPSNYRLLFLKAYIIGSSNGLVCLQICSYPDRSLFLWNPATREVQCVPDSTNNFGVDFCSLGFGFSTVVNDYKIVKIYRLVNSREIRVEIYSLSSGSWKEVVEFGNLLESMGFICLKQALAVTDQAMYYLAYKMDGDKFFSRFIVSFDMAKEVFRLIPVPSPNFLQNKALTTSENKLALLSHNELWIMEEEATSGGSEQRWNKESINSACPPEYYPVAIWMDEAVFIGKKPKIPGANPESFLYLFNLTTRKVKEVLISPEYGHLFCPFIYSESLVTIGDRFKNMIDRFKNMILNHDP